ncbi:hypothetical protein [Nocardioides sp. TF02-7]|uniref:hypothetical protein n=1 Tax=Nocardioides sp. TF02-7 TaxID=2917724 RepID=UPI001F05EF47|nr:hypothetical protein MF408_22740 [Nocardioides sp. TF02-7]
MDEFHFYGEPGRGWAWQVPLLELPQAQFLLMSATLGDVTGLAADLTRRNGRATAVVHDAVRPVPLSFSWSLTPLDETLEELVTTGQAPVYVVHFHPGGSRRARDRAARPRPVPVPGRGPRGDRRAAGRRPVRGRLREDPVQAAAQGGSASTTPACCRATGDWSSSSHRPAC